MFGCWFDRISVYPRSSAFYSSLAGFIRVLFFMGHATHLAKITNRLAKITKRKAAHLRNVRLSFPYP
jgi:hypothetical protein